MKNLFLIGFMGAGKSSVSAGLGRMLGREVVEMDERIAAQEGMSIPELFAQKGEPYFRACETALIKSFAQGAPRIVSCGGGVPLREENVAAMRESGTVVLLTASPEVILERVKDSDERPLLQGHKDVPYIAALMEQRRPKYEAAADITVDTSQLNIEEVCRQVLRQVSE
ncbi:MAG TPA: shikimate kinase [Candidatus Oscillibacter excrementigallinarum]|uniref:Shikimate kinase n=1 Tax=Candidatus Oscillibacter excrementigallinarum TaxID=2838716 RepID=A0A9D2LJT0_9FIRM|nr:shikimate kinase [Candidatus Oscillibacter excrementigallinarum]